MKIATAVAPPAPGRKIPTAAPANRDTTSTGPLARPVQAHVSTAPPRLPARLASPPTTWRARLASHAKCPVPSARPLETGSARLAKQDSILARHSAWPATRRAQPAPPAPPAAQAALLGTISTGPLARYALPDAHSAPLELTVLRARQTTCWRMPCARPATLARTTTQERALLAQRPASLAPRLPASA